jgi:hypothetical protein
VSIAISSDPRIAAVAVDDDAITARLMDGRVVSVPLAWSWRLSEATPDQRSRFEILGTGQGVRWPEIDEDISVEGMLNGVPAKRPKNDGLNQAQLRLLVQIQQIALLPDIHG